MTAVWVTGLGAVSACGWGVDRLGEQLARGTSAIDPCDRFDVSRHRTSLAGQVPARDHAIESGASTRDQPSWSDRFAVAAAREAFAQAGLSDAAKHPGKPFETGGPRIGLYFASSTGGMFEAERFFAARQGQLEPATRPRLRSLASQETSGPAEAVARACGIRGPVETVSSACASGGLAIGMALDALRADEVDIAIAGGADALCELTYAGFNALRAVDPARCRPFRADRAGMSLGEGAAALVLEQPEQARARGAVRLASLRGAGSSCDASHMTAPQPGGEGPARALDAALADAGVMPAEIAFVNAHGTGTPRNDAAEAKALTRALGDRAATVPITATKAVVGHLLGCAGALEAVATVLALDAGVVPPTSGDGAVDEALDVSLVQGSGCPFDGSCAISLSLAFGGANVALVFERAGAGR